MLIHASGLTYNNILNVERQKPWTIAIGVAHRVQPEAEFALRMGLSPDLLTGTVLYLVVPTTTSAKRAWLMASLHSMPLQRHTSFVICLTHTWPNSYYNNKAIVAQAG
jgi:hypothetical protein